MEPAFLQNSSDPVICVSESGSVLWSNAAAQRLLGAGLTLTLPSLDNLIGTSDAERVLRTRHFRALRVSLKTNSGECLKQSLIVADLGGGLDDSAILLIFKSAPLEDHGVAEREEFLATVAHDIKNPVGAVFGYADTLLDTPAGSGMTERQRDIITRIRATAGRAIDLVRNYQQLLEIREGRLIPGESVIDLNATVSTTTESMWRDDPNGPTITLCLSPTPLMVRAEKIHLERIFSNLFGNAIKFTPRGGAITVTTQKDGGSALLLVHNEGSVIPPADIPHLFSPYSRAANSRGVPGSGLGLYIVQSLAHSIDGSVKVESDAASGTTFTVELPLT